MFGSLPTRARVLGLGLMLLAACRSAPGTSPRPEKQKAASFRPGSVTPPPAPAAFQPGDAARGQSLVAEFECHRCHSGTGQPAPKLDQDCVGCHEQIANDKFRAAPAKLAKWKPHIFPYRDV